MLRVMMLATLSVLLATPIVVVPAAAAGASSQPVRRGVLNLDKRRLAVRGYDVVSYFEGGTPTPGVAEHQVRWRGGLWRFATAEHAEQFRAEPKRFAPQYGGYCAWAVSQGYTADADPLQWAIVDGRLYLNYNADVAERWDQDRERLIDKADRNWPRVLQ